MPFKGCLSDACVLMKIERFVLKPLRKIERFVLKQRTFRFADYTMHHLYYQLYYNGNQPILSDSDSHHQYLRPIIRHYVDAHHTQTSIYG